MNNEDTNMNNEATNKYPIFHDGNVLTSDDLNGSFDFLHKQVKNTRSLLFGQGILNGLTCKYDSAEGAITISSGTALTALGSLIEISKEMKYEYWVAPENYPEKEWLGGAMDDVVCFLESEEEIDGLDESEKESRRIEKHLDHTNDYLLGLQVVLHDVYKNEKDRICTEQSCSLRGDAVEIKFVPFLMKPSEGKNNRENPTFDFIPKLESSSASSLADYPILPIFLRKAADRYYDRIAAIKTGISAIEKIDFKGLLSEFQWQLFMSLFGAGTDLQTSMNLLDSIRFDNRRVNTYLSFVDDVHEAVNEFIAFYNDFQSRYQLTLDSRFDDAVILGKLVAADGAVDDATRYTWTETYRDYNRSKDERILVRLLKRITLLIESFSPTESIADEEVHFTPSSVNAKLGEREIPHYYQSWRGLTEYWDAHNDIHSNQQEAFASSADAFDKADLYRLSFDNLSAFKLDDLRAQAKENNLPIVVLKYELEGDDASYCLEDYVELQGWDVTCNAQDISNLIVDQEWDKDKKIIAEKDKSDVNTVIDRLWDYYSEYDVSGASDVITGLGLRDTLVEEIKQSIYLWTMKKKDKVMTAEDVGVKKALEFVMMAILCHRGNKEDLLNPVNLSGVDFVGGVEKRDVLLLVTHRDKVLTCLNMPYLSLILNQAMFEEQLKKYDQERKAGDLKYIFKSRKVEVVEPVKVDSVEPIGVDSVEPITDWSEEPAAGEDEEIVSQSEPQIENLDLFMLRYGKNKQNTAKFLKERKDIMLKDAVNLLDNLPMFVFDTETREEANEICFASNEELKASYLIVPAGMANKDTSGKLESFVPQLFDIKVTLFEEGKEKEAVKKLQTSLPDIKDSIEVLDYSGEKTVWMRQLTPERLSVEDLTNLKMDAVFELCPISE